VVHRGRWKTPGQLRPPYRFRVAGGDVALETFDQFRDVFGFEFVR
jgi:hypothetical protein